MRWEGGGATIHEQITKDILWDICEKENLTPKNQKIFYDEPGSKWYIADFWVAEIKLVVEIDGKSHERQKAYDAKRTRFLESQGNKVVRFQNEDVESRRFREMLLTALRRRWDEISENPRVLGPRKPATREPAKHKDADKIVYFDTLKYRMQVH